MIHLKRILIGLIPLSLCAGAVTLLILLLLRHTVLVLVSMCIVWILGIAHTIGEDMLS